MKQKILQVMMKEREFELKTPLQLFQFIDTYYRFMDSESKLELLGEAFGIDIVPVSDEDLDLSLPEYKLILGRIFRRDFKRETREPRPILLFIILDSAPDWLLKPLERPTTPEQLRYLEWLVHEIYPFREKGVEVNRIPDFARVYLRD